ncbi:MAG TPA: bifunctional adenosylcobinamide kinase/adenosylcobinamide-phosphate guanylyltransferase [Thermohalobaculum sp.]|nr:bifunctional adenosylcobinamide kinase/adenosylcobinamide-phosphate guanylyltransferase [Thermohalobaculum sp.]
MARVSLILGGARSGKSARGLALAAEPPHVFIATAEALDAEMAARIQAHKAERGPDWGLVEAPLDLAGAVRANAADGTTLLIDCLTLWLSNLMHHERDIEAETEALTRALTAAPGRVVLVSNELGIGLAPINALGRSFRDQQGRLNQRIAAVADHAEFVVAGLPLVLKAGP